MIRQGKTLLFALLVFALAVTAYGADMPTSFSDTHYYILSLGSMTLDLPALVQTAQAAGLSTIQFTEDVASVNRDGVETNDAVSVALTDAAILLVDSERFYLRQATDTYTFTVRPAEVGYELVINPSVELSITETLTAVLTELQQMGILGNEVNLDFASFAKADLKGPASPLGTPLDSTLYGLVVAEDWFAYANTKAITQVGLRVEVVAEKIPGGALATEFAEYVIDESESLVQLLLPIDRLVALAQSTSIGYVRLAYQPSVP
ncbi:hypothetical protein KKG90_07550 [Candidatus Bipolaricaulota bacterium]|nr:hypothetical protein [Candidatus Bipolaricaulota bacterium]